MARWYSHIVTDNRIQYADFDIYILIANFSMIKFNWIDI